jgi:hypothetical protein
LVGETQHNMIEQTHQCERTTFTKAKRVSTHQTSPICDKFPLRNSPAKTERIEFIKLCYSSTASVFPNPSLSSVLGKFFGSALLASTM